MPVTATQATLVRSTIPLLRQHGALVTTTFYRTLLTAHPHLSAIFNSANQTNGRQPRALTQLILSFAEHIHSLADLAPVLERVAQKHVSLSISVADYALVGEFLLKAFAAVLGPQIFTPAIHDAWAAAYGVLAHMLSSRESQLYKSFGPWTGFRPFRIMRKVQETRCPPHVYSLYLEPQDRAPLPAFLPGQYISLQIPIANCAPIARQTRQYSLSDRPRPEYYRITLKKETDPSTGAHGIVSSALVDHYNVDDIVHVTHPAGEFFIDVHQHSNTASVPLVLISAGVGVAPMMSILNTILAHVPPPSSSSSLPLSTASSSSSCAASRAPSSQRSASPAIIDQAQVRMTPTDPSLLSATSPSPASRDSALTTSTAASSMASLAPIRPITWIHGSHNDAPFDIYVRSIAHSRPEFHASIFKSVPADGDVRGVDYNFSGRIDLDRMSDSELHLAHGSTEYMVCGPEQFMYDVRNKLVARGVGRSRIKCELFNTGDMLAAKQEI